MDFKGGLSGIFDLMQHATKAKEEMERVQASLATQVTQGTSGAGMVTVKVNGRQEVLEVTISEELWNLKDRAMIQDLVCGAINEGLKNSKTLAAEEMKKIVGGLPLGPLANLFK
jgi:DNA-binding YbaB/EbfC family protein